MIDTNSLSHSKWNCKYHIVFAPKYRRMVVYGKIKADIGKILRTLCEQKKVNVIEAEACLDNIHMLVEIPPHLSVYKKETKISIMPLTIKKGLQLFMVGVLIVFIALLQSHLSLFHLLQNLFFKGMLHK